MNNSIVRSAWILALLLPFNMTHAAEPKQAGVNSQPFSQAYVWYDGNRERQIWLNPQAVAEFNPSAEGEASVKQVSPAATELPVKHAQQSVRFWQMDNAGNNAARSLRASHPQGKYSAVFHDGPNSAGRMRALPGNIIVYLDPQWDSAAVKQWLGRHKLEVVNKLEIGPNIYVIKTGPGMEALDTANALYRSGEVKAAFPDWWLEVAKK